MTENCRIQVITVDNNRIMGQNGRSRNPPNPTTRETLPPLKTPSLPPISKLGGIVNHLTVLPFSKDAPIVSAHSPFKVNIMSPILPILTWVDAILRRDKTNEISRIPRPLRKEGRLQMALYVANASLVPIFIETPDKGVVGARTMTR